LWFISFTLVGGLGVVVHLLVFGILHVGTPLGFEGLQVVATLVSMMLNFGLNKPITSRDQRPKGPRL
jgi:dolichol-phosphate mannosyltransferase